MIEIGDKILINVEAEVVRVSDAHGLCYEVKLPKKDYNHERIIFVAPDEVEKIETEF